MEISSVELQQKINAGEKLVVEFWAEWCGPCRVMKPIFERVANSNENDDVKMYTMDIDLNKEVAIGFGVRSIPTIKVFNGGTVSETKTGVLMENEIKKLVTDLING